MVKKTTTCVTIWTFITLVRQKKYYALLEIVIIQLSWPLRNNLIGQLDVLS